MAPADAASSRWCAALAFAASLLLLCALATSRVHLESHALAPPCSALRQLPAPPAAPPLPAGLHLAAVLLEGEPTPASGAAPLPWDPPSALLPALLALRARLAPTLDVTLAPPRRLAYGALADPGLLLPLVTDAAASPASPAYLVPAWAAPALRGLNPDWPLATGAADARVAYPLGEAAAAAAVAGGEGGAAASDPVLASSCQAAAGASSSSSSSAFGNAGSEPSLGRSLPATAAAAARSLQRLLHFLAPPPLSPSEACAPYNALLCRARGGNATSAPTPHCAHHRGGEVVNLIIYRAPAALSPLLFEAAEGDLPLPPHFHAQRVCEAPRASGNGSSSPAAFCATGTPLRRFPGLGWVYALPHAPPPSWQADAAAALSAAVLASLSAPEAAHAAAHADSARRAAAALCAEDEAAGGQWWWWHWLIKTRMEGLKRRIPRHVAAELAEAVAALARYESSSSGSEALAHARTARAHATAAAQDALATLDGYVAPAHVLAIYLPWWAPVVLPLALALAAPLLGKREVAAAGGGGRRRCACCGGGSGGSGSRAQAAQAGSGGVLAAGEAGAGDGKKER